MEVDEDLPLQVKYWLKSTSKNDCFFVLGPESGESKRIGAIKVLLFPFSEPLQNMLGNSELAEQGDVRVTDIEPGTFWTFLKCVYGGSEIVIPKLPFRESISLLYVLEKYLVNEIKPKIVSHILQMLPLVFDYVFCAISHPICFQVEELEKAVIEIISCNGDKILSSVKFLEVSSEGLLQIVKNGSLKTSETKVWDAVVKWAEYNAESKDGEILREQILPHLKYLRLCTFSCEEFCKKVIPTGVLTNEEVIEVCKYFSSGCAPKLQHVSNCTVPRLLNETTARTTLFHLVNDVENLTIEYSPDVMFHNYAWNILCQRNLDHFSLYLKCGGNPKDSSWSIYVDSELVLINQHDKPNFRLKTRHKFCSRENDWGYKSFYTWDGLMDSSNGFVKNNTIVVMIEMKVLSFLEGLE